jgi:hypothetical protein
MAERESVGLLGHRHAWRQANARRAVDDATAKIGRR